MLDIVKLFPTIKYYLIWKNIVNSNKAELIKRGFKINWIHQLGLIASFKDEDIYDINYVKNKLNEFEENSKDYSSYYNQYLTMMDNFKKHRCAEELDKHNEFFLKIGLRELIDDGVEILPLDDDGYVYSILMSYKIDKGFDWLFPINILFTILLGLYFLMLSIKNNL